MTAPTVWFGPFSSLNYQGQPNALGTLATYAAGTSTPQATYQDSNLTILNTNPITLNSLGQAFVFLTPGQAYKFVCFDSFGNQIWSEDNVIGVLITSASLTGLVNDASLAPTSQIYAIDQSYNRTAAEIAASVTPVNYGYAPGLVDRYGSNTTPGTTDMTAAWQSALAQAAVIGGAAVAYGPTGLYLVTAPLNATFTGTANQSGVIVKSVGGATQDAGSGILAKHNGVAVFDCTGNDSIQFEDVAIKTDASTFPKTGILFARNATGGSLINRILNCRIQGHFSVACVYNYGSEDDIIRDTYLANYCTSAGTKVLCVTGSNVSALTSPYTTIYFGGVSCIDHNYFGNQYYNAAGTSTSDCIYIEASDSVKVYGGWAACCSGSVSGRSLVYVDMTNGASNFGVINGLTGEVSTVNSLYGILFSNNAYTPTGWTVDGAKLSNTTFALAAAGSFATLDNFSIRGVQVQVGNGISIPGTLQNSIIDTSISGYLTIGTSTKNRLTGDTSKFTVTTRSNDYWIDVGATNKTFAPGIVSGTNGWTSVGAITQRAKYLLSGNIATFQIVVAGATSIACIAGATITTLPIASSDIGGCQVVDVTGRTIGGAQVNGTTITMPTIAATADSIVITGQYFVA
jgi:hypothetical protein